MPSLLIADDHPMIASALGLLIAGTEFAIVARAQDGEEALAMIAAHDPDIVLLDVNMPKLSGLEVLRRLRRDQARQKAVILTAGMNLAQLLDVSELEPEAILYKTSDPSLLLECLDRVSSGLRWVDPIARDHIEAARASFPAGPNFTPRERDLMQLVGRGLRNREISERLGITEGTVKVYLHAIFEKAGVASRTELAMKLAAMVDGVSDRES